MKSCDPKSPRGRQAIKTTGRGFLESLLLHLPTWHDVPTLLESSSDSCLPGVSSHSSLHAEKPYSPAFLHLQTWCWSPWKTGETLHFWSCPNHRAKTHRTQSRSCKHWTSNLSSVSLAVVSLVLKHIPNKIQNNCLQTSTVYSVYTCSPAPLVLL